MNTTKKLAFAALGATAGMTTSVFAQNDGASKFGSQNVKSDVQGATGTADTAVQRLIGNAMFFLAIIAVCYGIYGGFLMLTAGGEDEKVKQGRKILVQVAIGLIVIFLANSIVQFILQNILK